MKSHYPSQQTSRASEALEAAIQAALAFERSLLEAPIPSSPLSRQQARRLLEEAERYGVDLSLLERNLRLSPTERLEKLQGAAELVAEVQRAGAQARKSKR